MKREIKFRALTKTNNLMVFGDLTHCPNGEHRMLWFTKKGEISLDVDYDSFNEFVQSSTIGQFTGLKDKNGKEIYEGDIVLLPADQKCVIEYRDNYFIAIAITPPKNYPKDYIYFNVKELIGNIHENPDLIRHTASVKN